MVEVFKTNIAEKTTANAIIEQLLNYFPEGKINFDLEDCDRILRIENHFIEPTAVIKVLADNNYQCEILE